MVSTHCEIFRSVTSFEIGGIGKLPCLVLLVFISLTTSLPNPNPFLLVNKGEINIHDSVQRFAHSRHNSPGGSAGSLHVAVGTAAKKATSPESYRESRAFQNGAVFHETFHARHENFIKSDPGFQPSLFPFSGETGETQPPNLGGPKQHHSIISSTTTEYIHEYETNPPVTQNLEHSFIPAAPSYNNQDVSLTSQEGHQPHPVRRRPFSIRKMLARIQRKVRKAIKTVQNAIKSIFAKEKRQRKAGIRKQGTRYEYDRRRNVFGLDLWNSNSLLGRLYQWFRNAFNIHT